MGWNQLRRLGTLVMAKCRSDYWAPEPGRQLPAPARGGWRSYTYPDTRTKKKIRVLTMVGQLQAVYSEGERLLRSLQPTRGLQAGRGDKIKNAKEPQTRRQSNNSGPAWVMHKHTRTSKMEGDIKGIFSLARLSDDMLGVRRWEGGWGHADGSVNWDLSPEAPCKDFTNTDTLTRKSAFRCALQTLPHLQNEVCAPGYTLQH